MACGSFWTGSAWLQPTEIHAWDGDSFVQATEVYVYDGAVWVRFFPCAGGDLAITLTEDALILDQYTLVKISRDVIKGPYVELILGTEDMLTAKRMTLTEASS